MRSLFLWAAVAVLASCSRVDGQPPGDAFGRACNLDLDCGAGRHCDAGRCALVCTRDADCDGSSCSPCGRCVAPGQSDVACLPPTEQPCDSDTDCGEGYGCGSLGLCAARCSTDDACLRGLVCSADLGLCEERCAHDGTCYFRGFARECKLPSGVDQEENRLADEPVLGQCVARPGGIGLTEATGPAAGYQGVWGQLFVSSVRNEGLPVVGRTDSAAIQLQLVKIRADGPDLEFTVRWCSARFLNFNENDIAIKQLIQIIVPDRAVDALDVVVFRARSVPSLAAGVTFSSDEMLDLRGAHLASPDAPLPTRFDLTTQRDQDRDGHPGMTSLLTGLVSGELYQAQRTRAVLRVQVVDTDHLHGLMDTQPESTILGASNPTLINDGTVAAHPQADRSYFRAVRLAESGTCEDVLQIGAVEGGWLAYDPHFDDAKRP